MNLSLLLFLYNLLLLPFLVLSFPAWLLTMTRRGGYGSGLKERLGLFTRDAELDVANGIYVHAVSVGEVNLALKLISAWQKERPDEVFVLAATTATGHAVAKKSESDRVRVIYSPVDLHPITAAVLRRFSPRAVVLIESEIWPNLIHLARSMRIPVAIANARLSPRSQRRYRRVKWLIECVLEELNVICVPEQEDVARWEQIGARQGAVIATGGLKYDLTDAPQPLRREEFQTIIDAFGKGRKVIVCASTFSGEEEALALAIRKADEGYLPVIVPRHAERRAEVQAALERAGLTVALRSNFTAAADCLVVDSTGELRDWTAHADLLIIGKSWLERGGQSPVEAISAGVPVITGPDMSNFSSLMDQLLERQGVMQLQSLAELPASIRLLMAGERRERQCDAARQVLDQHAGAARRMVLRILSTLR